jgi:predicted transcriptional regulator of viral defense system
MLGVTGQRPPEETYIIRVTNLERTLIDIAVRPFYSGGVHKVLEAYKRAAERVSVEQMATMLQTLDYTYPYHQAIGFYLERSGYYDDASIKLFHEFPKEFDFYLANGMKSTAYSKRAFGN